MKKIKLISCLALITTLLLTSCAKNQDQIENTINLTVITDGIESIKSSTSIFKKLGRKIRDLFYNTDDQSIIRERAVLAKFQDSQIIKIAIASSWNANITDAHDAIMLALKEVNEAGGVAGAKIELIEADDEASIETGTRVAYKFAQDPEVFGIIGHAYSDISTPASLVYNYYGMLMFSPISSSHSLTRQKDSLIFRNVQDDSEHGKIAAEFCTEQGWKNVAIIYPDVTFGESMANAFELECGSSSITVATRDSFIFNQTDSEYKNLFKKWKNNYKFDAVYVIGNMPQIGKIVDYMRQADISQPIIGSDSFDDPRLEVILAESEDGRLFAVSPFNSNSQNPNYLKFVEKFEKTYGRKPDQEGVQWYDAFMVLTEAIDKNGQPSPKEVAEVLRTNTWSQAAGPYTFDDHGNVVGKPLVIKELKDGKFNIIK